MDLSDRHVSTFRVSVGVRVRVSVWVRVRDMASVGIVSVSV